MTTAPEPLPCDGDQDTTQSWDDFWAEIERKEAAERGRAATVTIRGVQVRVPHDLPLRFDRRLERLQGSTSEDDIRALLEDLFGQDVLDQWVENGMTSMEFRVLLRWAVANGRGRAMSFAEAYEAVKEDEQGKAETTTTAEMTPSSGGSASTGRSSRPTSAANTVSARRRSQT